jgi:hypothetical protein
MTIRDLLNDLLADGFTVAVDGGGLAIRPASRLSDEQRQAIRAARPEFLALLSTPADAPPGQYRLTAAQADRAHAVPWDEAACQRFTARTIRLIGIGLKPTDADSLAERLHLRDVDSDDRRMCIECRNCLSGLRCTKPRAARVSADLPRDLALTLKRCPAFSEGDAAWAR